MADNRKVNWKEALDRKVDYPTREKLYKAIQKDMLPQKYAEFETAMAKEVSDQVVFNLKEIP